MRRCGRHDEEQGFALIGLMVTIFIILLVLGVAAPRVAKELRRDREVEAMQRGNQYVRAVQLYYRKFGHYPGSIEQLEKTNNIRFLRQKYVDPMTGKSDWRLIHVGEAKTTVKGFFGQALTGMTPGLGSAAGLASTGGIGAGAAGSASAAGSSAFGSSSFGSTSSGATGSAFGSSGLGGASGAGSNSPGFGSSATSTGATSAGTGAGAAASSTAGAGTATSGTGNGIGGTTLAGAFVGVGSAATGDSILDLNEQTTYETWEFIYDPRIEQLKAAANLFGNGSSSGLGSASGNASPGLGGAGSTGGFGASPGGFGSSPGGFGSSSPAGSTTPATGGTKP